MDASHFDAVLSAFTLTRSRRGLGSALAGLVLGGTLGSVALEQAAAKKKNKNKKKPDCKNGKKRCGKYCISKNLCCTDNDCPVCDELCGWDGKCFPTGQAYDCGGQCIPITECCALLVPLCNACQEAHCVNGTWQCVTVKPGQPCGPLCCKYDGCGTDGTDYRCCGDEEGIGPYCPGFQHCCNPGWTCNGKTCKPPA